MRDYGARIAFSSEFEGSDEAIRLARRRYQENPEKYFMPDPCSHPVNPRGHYETTAVAIWEQTKGQITHFVSTMGTSGTAMGCPKRLKEYKPDVPCVCGQPRDALHGLEGLTHMPSSIKPGFYAESIVDEIAWLDTEAVYDMMKRLAREEGLMVGCSSGAAMVASLELARRIERGVIVTIFPDNGDRYGEV